MNKTKNLRKKISILIIFTLLLLSTLLLPIVNKKTNNKIANLPQVTIETKESKQLADDYMPYGEITTRDVYASSLTQSAVLMQDQNGNDYLYVDPLDTINSNEKATVIARDGALEVKFAENHIKQVATAWNHLAVLTTDDLNQDHLYLYGKNTLGQLGNGTTTDSNVFIEVTLPETTIEEVAVGNNVSGVITTDGDNLNHLYVWGSNASGQLGLNSNEFYFTTPQEVTMLSFNQEIRELHFGNNFAGVVVKDYFDNEKLYMWGDNSYGQLAQNRIGGSVGFPMQISLPNSLIKDLFMIGNSNSVGILLQNNDIELLYVWGENSSNNLLGLDPAKEIYPFPTMNNNFSDMKVKELVMGIYNSGAIVTDQTNQDHLYMWGDNSFGGVGNNTTNVVTTPTEINLAGDTFHSLSTMFDTTSVVTYQTGNSQSEKIYLWGEDNWNISDIGQILEPTNIVGFSNQDALNFEVDYQKQNIEVISTTLPFTISPDFVINEINLITKRLPIFDFANASITNQDSLEVVIEFDMASLTGILTINNLIPETEYDNLILNIPTYDGNNLQITLNSFVTSLKPGNVPEITKLETQNITATSAQVFYHFTVQINVQYQYPTFINQVYVANGNNSVLAIIDFGSVQILDFGAIFSITNLTSQTTYDDWTFNVKYTSGKEQEIVSQSIASFMTI